MMQKLRASAPYVAALCGNVLWGFSYLLTRTALQTAAPEVLLSQRFLLAFFLLNVPVLLGKARVRWQGKKQLPVLLLCLTNVLCFFFESYGILYTNATFAGIVLSVVPVVSALLAMVFLREYPTYRQACFCVLPVVGVIMITRSGNSLGIIQPLGVALLICSCLSSAAYKIANRKSAQIFTPFERTYYTILTCAVVYTAAAVKSVDGNWSEYLRPLGELSYLLPMLMLSVSCSLCANLLVNYAAGRMEVVKISAFGSVSTICSLIGGAVILHEPVTWVMALGAALILLGVNQVTRPAAPHESRMVPHRFSGTRRIS